jgi:hypothetical protein
MFWSSNSWVLGELYIERRSAAEIASHGHAILSLELSRFNFFGSREGFHRSFEACCSNWVGKSGTEQGLVDF